MHPLFESENKKHNIMTTYLHKNWCGLGDRLVVHPRGLPPGWVESEVIEPRGQEALDKVRSLIGQPFEPTPADKLASGPLCVEFRLHSNRVYHLNPNTLDLIETFSVI